MVSQCPVGCRVEGSGALATMFPICIAITGSGLARPTRGPVLSLLLESLTGSAPDYPGLPVTTGDYP